MAATNSRWWRPWREAEGATILHVDLSPDADREAYAFALLDDEEKTRWRRFLAERARREFTLCRAALRIALAERLGCADRALSFGYLEHGKPFARVKGRRAAIGAGFSLNPSGFEIPGPMLQGGRAGLFRFPHAPTESWRLLDLGEARFAAALAYRETPSPPP